MYSNFISRRLLSAILAVAFFFLLPLPALSSLIQEEPLPDQTEAATLPVEEILIQEETEPLLEEPVIRVEEGFASASAAMAAQATRYTISQVLELPTGTENVSAEGIVVFTRNTLAVLQDDTGGIRLSFDTAPDLSLGDVLLVTGSRSGGLAVTEFTHNGTAQLPAVEAELTEAPENIRILVRGAVLGRRTLEQNGVSLTLSGSTQDAQVGDTVDAWGVILDGVFYADTITPVSETEPSLSSRWNFYFGQLHAHTAISDGTGTVEEAYAYAKNTAGLDFFAVTDHSNSFDNHLQGTIAEDGSAISQEWAAGKTAAAQISDDSFLGIFAYEMTWPETAAIGHMNTFATPGWQSRDQEEMDTLAGYCDALTTVPDSISQFNHPSPGYGEFSYFRNYDAQWDSVIQLLEVGSEGGSTAYSYYTTALDQGWHLAPTNNQANHDGNWGTASDVRTVILAESLSEEHLFSAIRNHRVYATEDRDLQILFTLNGADMGSILSAQNTITIAAAFADATDDAIGTVEVITRGGAVLETLTLEEPSGNLSIQVEAGYDYYYLRITQPDGDIAVTAPVWVEDYRDWEIQSVTADLEEPLPEEPVTLTLNLSNQERVDLVLEEVTFSEGEEILHSISDPGSVPALGTRAFTFTHSWAEPGEKTITAAFTGTIGGQACSQEATVTIAVQSPTVTDATIRQAREGTLGETYRVSGYVTAGNSNPYTCFSDTIYLQDTTGGIAVTGSFPESLSVGTPLEVTGCLRKAGDNLVLELVAYTLPGGSHYRHVPPILPIREMMDYTAHGGELLQAEGEVISLEKTEDGKGIRRFTLRDSDGNTAPVLIESTITSGAYGVNDLADVVQKGHTVRVIGLLHVDENGDTVLRVRNCDEVVYVPPVTILGSTSGKADSTNPKTGDRLFFLVFS